MGIKGLSKVIQKIAPHSTVWRGATHFSGCSMAIDTNIFLYSFAAAIRTTNEKGSKGVIQLVDSKGNSTSHLKGILNRTLNLLESGVTPIYVLEGKSPIIKASEVEKRRERREKLQIKIEEAKSFGDLEGADKLAKQLVYINQDHIKETEHLLKMLGIPTIQAPGESEAQCAELCKKGQVAGIVTRDMDALPLATPVMLRNLHTKHEYPPDMKTQMEEIRLFDILVALEMDISQFVDFCILLGCDYCETMKGVGPTRALELIKKHYSIENILSSAPEYSVGLNDNFDYVQARESFHNPNVIPAEMIAPSTMLCFTPNYDEAKQYLVEKSFDTITVDQTLARYYRAQKNVIDNYYSSSVKL